MKNSMACSIFFCVLAATSGYAGDVGWPREYAHPEYRVVVYQPQVDEWENQNKITFLAAVEVTPKPDGKAVYGILEVEANTTTTVAARTVTLSDLKAKDIRFPKQADELAAKLAGVVKASLPSTEGKTMEIALDRILVALEKPEAEKGVEVNLKAPQIFYSDKPAIAIIFIGKPKFKEVKNTSLMAALNTNWDVFLDTTNQHYYLLNGDTWLVSNDPLKDSWKIAKAKDLPADLSKLPNDANWQDVLKNLPGKSEGKTPKVFVSTEPAELIVTDGEPTFTPIPGTNLMDVANSDSTLFYHSTEKQFYLQVAGRWFRAKHLKGPWSAASEDLPGDFASIPDENENAYVKASVPGTEEAKDAVILASVPQKTVIKLDEAKCAVTYDGAPRFLEVQGTTVKYAINSPNDVFLLADGGYYCCSQGMWFAAPKPEGPWLICTKVPSALYTIPSNHPKHNVTYVYVYQSTPTTVQVGYTSGYSGEYVAKNGVLMFGLGVAVGAIVANNWDDDCWGWHYGYHCSPAFYSYGCGAVYHNGYGGYYRGGAVYGPYGGAGRAGYYNPSTGGWARGATMYGPNGSASARAGYNPFTDTYGARATVNTPYGSSGRFYAERGNTQVWGGHESGARGTVGWAETNKGGQAVHVDNARGGQGTVAKDKDGNVYAAKDGNVYKKNNDGSWSERDNGEWNQATQPRNQSASANATSTSSARRESSTTTTSERTRENPSAQPSTTTSAKPRETPSAASQQAREKPATSSSSRFKDTSSAQQQLDYDSRARDRGNANTQRATTSGNVGRTGRASGGSGGNRSGGRGRN